MKFKASILSFFFPVLLFGQYDLSIGTGAMWLDADVDPVNKELNINALQASIAYQIFNDFYLDGNIGYGKTKGLEKSTPWTSSTVGGGLIEPIYSDYTTEIYAPYHATKIISLNVGPSFKKYFFHDIVFVKLGISGGVSHATVHMNLYDSDDNIYILPTPFFPRSSPRLDIYTEDLFDDTFESKFENVGTIFQIGGNFSVGLNVANNGYLSVGLSIQTTNEDYLDGISFRTALDATNNNDMIVKTNIMYTQRFGTFSW